MSSSRAPRIRSHVALDAELTARIAELASDVADAVAAEVPRPEAAELSADAAGFVLDQLWKAVLAETTQRIGGSVSDPGLLELLCCIRSAEAEIAKTHVTTGETVLQGLGDGLAAVRDARTVADLIDMVPEIGCRSGFDRVLVSRVEDSIWKLHAMHTVREPRWADELVAAGQAMPPTLDGRLVESDVVERGETCLVHDARHNDRVDRNLIRVGRSTSYVIAPLALQGDVVGLVHGDRYYQGRDVGPVDRALMAVLADSLSQSLSRLALLEGLTELRGVADRLLRPSCLPAPTGPPRRPEDETLTTREAEVMELLAAGSSNRVISRRLRISEGTVKSHVTHILRKLGVSSRSEAVSVWLRGGTSVLR